VHHHRSGPSLSGPNLGGRLRFVFRDAEMQFDLGGGATFEDVAVKLDDPALQGRGRPVAVLVALDAAPAHTRTRDRPRCHEAAR
jgi:hypothetical protein